MEVLLDWTNWLIGKNIISGWANNARVHSWRILLIGGVALECVCYIALWFQYKVACYYS